LNFADTLVESINVRLPQYTGYAVPAETLAVVAVTTVSYGNVGRNTLRGPGNWITDMSIVRDYIHFALHANF